MFKNNFYKFLVLFFYYVGDFFSKFSYEWTFAMYQKLMNLSLICDEKINFWWWKEPSINNKTNL
jgi:hypothetical protein